jgi:hypothetical protein
MSTSVARATTDIVAVQCTEGSLIVTLADARRKASRRRHPTEGSAQFELQLLHRNGVA